MMGRLLQPKWDFPELSLLSLPVDEVAEKIGTIHYEVVCAVGKRVPRVYIA
jgi:alanine racemase